MSDLKPGMINIDSNRPLVEGNSVQLRLVTLMAHPDYSLDKAFNGTGKIDPNNRNEELDQMPLVDLLQDTKRRIEELIDQDDRHWCDFYGYAGFMTDAWQRACLQGLVSDPYYARTDYINGSLFFSGQQSLVNRRKRMHNEDK